MNSNRSLKNSASPPGPPGQGQPGEGWGDEDLEEEIFDRPTIIPSVLPTEAQLIAARPPPSSREIDEAWEHPSGVIEKTPPEAPLEFDLDLLGPPPPTPQRGPGKARPISFSSLPPPPPPRPPAATLAVEHPLAFDTPGLAAPARETIDEDFEVDFDIIRNPRMKDVPSPAPAIDSGEPHTAPYPFDLDPSENNYAAGQFRQPPPIASPTHPLEELDALFEPPPSERPRPPMMGDAQITSKQQPPIERHGREMRDKFALGDFSGALKAAEALLICSPSNAEALRFAESCRSRLRGMYEAKLGSLSRVPRVILPPEQVRWLSLDHRAGFILSCVDGYSTIEEILDVSGMPELDTLRILHDLLLQKVISVA
ncbi:MAG: hypothetical protein MUF64_28330 [Polyangiaceae bacterium]|nr:hypothetical protein [Polyangiaceae bacterium]